MKKAFNVVTGLFAMSALTLSACGNKSSGGGEAPPPAPVILTTVAPPTVPPPNTGINPNQMMTYGYVSVLNGVSCTTGAHTLKYSEYCVILLDEAQNNSCAIEQRKFTYNRDCVSGGVITGGLTGQFLMPAGSAAYCRVTGVNDGKSRFFRGGNFSQQNFIPWTGGAEQSFPLSTGGQFSQAYGSAFLKLTPATIGTVAGAIGELTVIQKGGVKYTAVSKFSSRMIFEISKFSENKKIVVDCIPGATLIQGQADLTHVTCQVGRSRPQEIIWDTHSASSTELKSRDVENLKVDLIPAANGNEELIQIAGDQIDGDNDIFAKAAVRSGLQVSYKDRTTGTQLMVRCSAALK